MEIGEIARRWNDPWSLGEALFWQQVVGLPVDAPGVLADPYALLFAGDWRGAVADWRRRGYRYEEGLALMMGDADGRRDAIRVFEALGARAAAERVRDRLRDQGERALPRGPQERHRAHPVGLTTREEEMLGLLAEGLSNAEIAARVHRSIRTIEHHVAALIDKLGARNRHEAVDIARERGLIGDSAK